MKSITDIKTMTKDKLLHLSLIPKWGTTDNEDVEVVQNTNGDMSSNISINDTSVTTSLETKTKSPLVHMPANNNSSPEPCDLKALMQSSTVPKMTYFFEKPDHTVVPGSTPVSDTSTVVGSTESKSVAAESEGTFVDNVDAAPSRQRTLTVRKNIKVDQTPLPQHSSTQR